MVRNPKKCLSAVLSGLMLVNSMSVIASAASTGEPSYDNTERGAFSVQFALSTSGTAYTDNASKVAYPAIGYAKDTTLTLNVGGRTYEYEAVLQNGRRVFNVDNLTSCDDISDLYGATVYLETDISDCVPSDVASEWVEEFIDGGTSYTLSANDLVSQVVEGAELSNSYYCNLSTTTEENNLCSVLIADATKSVYNQSKSKVYQNKSSYGFDDIDIVVTSGGYTVDSSFDDKTNVLYYYPDMRNDEGNIAVDGVTIYAEGTTREGEKFLGTAEIDSGMGRLSADADILFLKRDFNLEIEYEDYVEDGYTEESEDEKFKGDVLGSLDLEALLNGDKSLVDQLKENGYISEGGTMTGNSSTNKDDKNDKNDKDEDNDEADKDIDTGIKFNIISYWDEINTDNVKANTTTAKLVDDDNKVVATIDLTKKTQYVELDEGYYKLYGAPNTDITYEGKLKVIEGEVTQIKLTSLPTYTIKVKPTNNKMLQFKVNDKTYSTTSSMVFAVKGDVKYAVANLDGYGQYVTCTDANPRVTVKIKPNSSNIITDTDNSTNITDDEDEVPNTGDTSPVVILITSLVILAILGSFAVIFILHKKAERSEK